MRKYVKPVLFYEHYELSQHIADCHWELISVNEDTCQAKADDNHFGGTYSEGNLFTIDKGCYYNEENYQEYCYENGTDSTVVLWKS